MTHHAFVASLVLFADVHAALPRGIRLHSLPESKKVEQENPYHIFVALFALGKKVGWNEEELAMELEEE